MRKEYIGSIRSTKSDFDNITKEIDKIHNQLKKERLLDSSQDIEHDQDSDKYHYLNNKLSKQNNNLNKVTQMGKEINSTQDKTLEELLRQKQKLRSADEMLTEVEQTLSLHDQIIQVMGNRELFQKLLLVFIIILLFVANILVIYIKFG